MSSIQLPSISRETLLQVWETVDSLRRRGRVKALISRVGGFFSNLLFLLGIVFFVNGLILDRAEGSYCVFLKNLPVFSDLWETAAGALVSQEDSLYAALGKLLIADYAVSALFFALLAGLVVLLYHPKQKPVPEGTYPEQTSKLKELAYDARASQSKTKLSASPIATVLAITAAFALFFAYAFYLGNANKITALLSIFPFDDAATNGITYVLFGLILSSILCTPLLLITRFLYSFKVPADLLDQVEKAALFSEEALAGLTDAERKVLGETLREEALDLERTHMYYKAKEKLLRAAHLGDAAAMEHYARHCLIGHLNESAKFWLTKCAASGEASEAAMKMLQKLEFGRKPDVRYLDNVKKQRFRGVKALFRFAALVLALAVLGGSCYGVWILFDSTNHPEKHPEFLQLMDQARERFEEYFPEEALNAGKVTYSSPVMTLRPMLIQNGERFEADQFPQDTKQKTIILCYGQDMGGDLYFPYQPRHQWAGTASLYTGEDQELIDISHYVSLDETIRTMAISEEFLLTLEPGEYYVILDIIPPENPEYPYPQAVPFIVEKETTIHSRQAGLAADGDETGRIYNDLDDPRDITLPFYNIGKNPIVSVRLNPYIPNSIPRILKEGEDYTVNDAGNVITLKKEYLQTLTHGDSVWYQFTRKDMTALDVDYKLISTVRGEDTGTLTINGPTTYSLSKGGDYVAPVDLVNAAQIHEYNVELNGERILQEKPSEAATYFDYSTRTLTIPEDKFKDLASPGDTLTIRLYFGLISYQTVGVIHTVTFTE